MSLFASLTTAITGLNAQQDAIANISDNIANSQTVGFKEIGTSFQNLVTSSTPELNQPGGVVSTPVYENTIGGPLNPSDVTTSLAINGQGFFQVKAPPTATAQGVAPNFPSQDLYTQAGDFTLNAQGFLVNSAGYFLTGYPVNPQTQAVNTATTVPIQVSQLVDAPEPTANLGLSANLASTYAFQNLAPVPPATTGQPNPLYVTPPPITETVFDAEGNPQTETIQFNHPNPATPNVWTATIQDVAPTAGGNNNNAISASALGNTPTDEPAVLQLTFSDGQNAVPPLTQVLPAGTLANITNITPGSLGNGAAPTGATVPAVKVGTIANQGPATFTITQDFGSGPQPITFNFGDYGTPSGVTQFAGTTVTGTATQDGVPSGDFENLSISSSGLVDLNYTNGQSKPFFQVAVAQFNAPDQLQRVQGAAFTATIDSGPADLNPPGTNGAGTIDPSTLEQSNVDIATQFTQLISAQQVYSANSKVITTADQLLSTVIALIQQ
jgi:flagellar hook protein FlgE